MIKFYRLALLINFISLLGIASPATTQVTTGLFAIHEPLVQGEEFDILADQDGRVYKLGNQDIQGLKILRQAMSEEREVILTFSPSDDTAIQSVRLGEPKEMRSFRESDFMFNPATTAFMYPPSELSDTTQLRTLFDSAYSYPASEVGVTDCFNRAHYWARTYQISSNVVSQKVFLFFTQKYIREHQYKWWYHVAPLVLVKLWPWGTNEYVMDPTFLKGPVLVDEWASNFAQFANYGCAKGNSINDFESKQESADCVIIKSDMYHFFPRDLIPNAIMSSWRCADLNAVMSRLPKPHFASSWDPNFLPADCR